MMMLLNCDEMWMLGMGEIELVMNVFEDGGIRD